MLKYLTTAVALKAFSSTPVTRRMYRATGNRLGGRKRETGTAPSYYFERVNRMLALSRHYSFPKDGDRFLELGTGWMHWEALTARLFFDIKAVLFDVWDNRQFAGLQNYIAQLETRLDSLSATPEQKQKAAARIKEVRKTRSFEELYDLLGFEYMINSSGTLDPLPRSAFDVVVSAGVFEHIYAQIVPGFVKSIGEVLRPGGYSFHSINIRDHLYLYDRSVCAKQYLKYSEPTWHLLFQNDVQYINRIQRSEWLDIFRKANLELVTEEVEREDLSRIQIAKQFQALDRTTLECGGLTLVHRKPMAATT